MSASANALVQLSIDLDAIAANWRLLAAHCLTSKAAAVVKADAYGLGAEHVAKRLYAEGCRTFFVATLDEGIALRPHVGDAQLFVLSGPTAGTEEEFTRYSLIPIVNSVGQLSLWRAWASRSGRVQPCGLQTDSGMTRLGLGGDDIARLAHDPQAFAGIPLVLGMSHLACADTPDHLQNHQQLVAFTQAMAQLPGLPLSLAASSGIFLGPEYHFQIIRPGAALYGINPTPHQANPMRQVVQVKAKILQIRDVDTPQRVGYGASHSVAAKGRIATVGIGYADGYFRAIGNRGHGVFNGHLVPVVGRISMDLTTFDISAIPADHIREGDWIDILGAHYGVDDLAAEAGTIGYEILTQLSRRAHRTYAGDVR